MLDDNELLFDELYEKTKDCGRVQFINLLMEKERDNQELKKRLEKKYEKVGTLTIELLYEENTKLINQQKEFIEWLERKLFLLRDEASELALGMCSTNYQDTKIEVYKEVLSKYKEIIGSEVENNAK